MQLFKMGTFILRVLCENGYTKAMDRVFFLFRKWDWKVSIGELERIPIFLFACQFGTRDFVLWMTNKLDPSGFGEKLLDIKDDDGSSALHYACQGNQVDVVQYLIHEKKFPINAEDKVSTNFLTFFMSFMLILTCGYCSGGDCLFISHANVIFFALRLSCSCFVVVRWWIILINLVME
jgi:hypothetical protein